MADGCRLQKVKKFGISRPCLPRFDEISRIDGRIKSGSNISTYDINLVGFRPVTREFVRLNCIQQASISSRLYYATIR